MNKNIKIICLILAIVAIIFGIWGWLVYQECPEDINFTMAVIGSFWLGASLITLLIYRLLKKFLMKSFNWFIHLTFERKIMLLTVIAILIATAFYCWEATARQAYYQKQERAIKISPFDLFDR